MENPAVEFVDFDCPKCKVHFSETVEFLKSRETASCQCGHQFNCETVMDMFPCLSQQGQEARSLLQGKRRPFVNGKLV